MDLYTTLASYLRFFPTSLVHQLNLFNMLHPTGKNWTVIKKTYSIFKKNPKQTIVLGSVFLIIVTIFKLIQSKK